MPKYFLRPTKHLFGSLGLVVAQMLTAEEACMFWDSFSFFQLKEVRGNGRAGGRGEWVIVEGGRSRRVYVHVCVYTQHAKIPQPDPESYPGTCNARLRRKFHILRYRRTSISSRVLDGFQNSYNCCCYKSVQSM